MTAFIDRPRVLFGLTALAVFAAAAALAAPQQAALGTIDFPTSGSPAAQEHFIRGVLLMHSFEYGAAGEAFREAQRAEPGFAMAYWGEAMSYNHPIWQQQDRDAALAALSRLAPTPQQRAARAGSDKERDWLAAVETLYGEGDKNGRDFTYRDAMRRMHEKYPDDSDVATFYALSLLGTSHEGRDFGIYMQSAAIAAEVFQENPDHPGAVHYLIHSFDDPIHAPLGLPAARAYSTIAPAASHAQHMTSHIFVAMGMWDDAVAANEVARDVQDAEFAEGGRPPNHCGHYSSWLQYGYLEQGRIEAAEREMNRCHETMLANPGPNSGYFANMRARFVVDSRRWGGAEHWTAEVEGLGPRANYGFTSGLAAIEQGDVDVARQIATRLDRAAERDDAPAFVGILALELEALVALAGGAQDEAVAKLEEATVLEENMPFAFGPPAVIKPSHELLGEVLLELERFDEAVVAFEGALARAAGRTASLAGLAHAADGAGDAAKAEEARATLHAIWHRADDGYVEEHQQR